MSWNNEDNYIHVPGFAIRTLELKGNELLIFSIIHSYSRDGESKYYGSINYLCEMTNASRSTVQRTLDNLVTKNLIIKEEVFNNGVKFCKYSSNKDEINAYEKGDQGCQNDTGCVEMNPNNKYLTLNNNNIYNIKTQNDTGGTTNEIMKQLADLKSPPKKTHTLEDTIKDLDEGIPIKSNKYAFDYFRYYYEKVYGEKYSGNYNKGLGQIKNLNRDLGYGEVYNELLFKLEEWLVTWKKLDWQELEGNFNLSSISVEWIRNKIDKKLNKLDKNNNTKGSFHSNGEQDLKFNTSNRRK